MNKKSVKDVNVKGKKCLVRVDFNVPMKDGVITDENRILGALPTIKYLMEQGAKVVLCSHLGKPHNVFSKDFKLNKKELKAIAALPVDQQEVATAEYRQKALKDAVKFSLRLVAERLNQLLDGKVTFATDVVGEDACQKVANLKEGYVVLLENTRFHAGEEGRCQDFCQKLANFCDVYVNDAFGTAHRSHATTAAIVEYGFVKTAVCGFLIEKELSVMANALENPVRPFVAILGGAKVADKLNVINNLLNKCDSLIIGGGMAYTFLKAKGYEVGKSLLDEEKVDYCRQMMEKATQLGKNIYLPIDCVTIDAFPNPIDAPVDTLVVPVDAIPSNREGADIGPETCKLYQQVIQTAKTVVWNGPMGVFENPTLAQGTNSVANAMANATNCITIIGGGDSAAAVAQLGYADKMSHVSTGGGASLELFEGKVLPGINCLNDK